MPSIVTIVQYTDLNSKIMPRKNRCPPSPMAIGSQGMCLDMVKKREVLRLNWAQ